MKRVFLFVVIIYSVMLLITTDWPAAIGYTGTAALAHHYPSTYFALVLWGLEGYTSSPGVITFLLHFFLGLPLLLIVLGVAHWEGRRAGKGC